jgi:hypothetical protein
MLLRAYPTFPETSVAHNPQHQQHEERRHSQHKHDGDERRTQQHDYEKPMGEAQHRDNPDMEKPRH